MLKRGKARAKAVTHTYVKPVHGVMKEYFALLYIFWLFKLGFGLTSQTFVVKQSLRSPYRGHELTRKSSVVLAASRHDDIDDDDPNEENNLEKMIEDAKREQDLQNDIKKAEERARKRAIIKKKADKKYEAYWEREKKKGPNSSTSSRDRTLLANYYGLNKNQMLGDKVTGANPPAERPDEWDYDVKPGSSKEYVGTTISLAGALTTALLVKKWASITKFVSVSTKTRPLDSRVIRKDFSLDELDRAAAVAIRSNKAGPSDSVSMTLPEVPSALWGLPVIRGDVNRLGSSKGLLGDDSRDEVIVVVFWRPTDAISVRALHSYSQLEAKFPQTFRCVGVLAPKFPAEADLDSATTRALLVDSDLPKLCLLDKKLDAWRSLGISVWPTTLLLHRNRVIFAMEGARALSDTGGRAAAALAGQAHLQRSNSVLRAWNTAALPTSTTVGCGSAGKCVQSLLRPTRLATNFRTGRVYVADTGHHRILECEVIFGPKSKDTRATLGTVGSAVMDDSAILRVRRVFGSLDGEAGCAVAGCTASQLRFNKPMGLAVDVDGFLYVADSGNDAVRRVDISDSANAGNTVLVPPSPPNADSSGVSYDFPTLQRVEDVAGASIQDMSRLTAEELARLLEDSMRSGKLDDVPDVSVGQLLGRTRPLINPTDVGISDAFFYVGAPGSRQVWRVEGGGFTLRPVFGSGLVGRRNTRETAAKVSFASAGAFLSDTLRFSEPMGVVGSSGRLFCVDADACSLRSVNLIEGFTRTVAGGGRGVDGDDDGYRILFDGFGDKEGSGPRAELQYPTAAANGATVDELFICDTLNHRVREVNVQNARARVRTLLGTGRAAAKGHEGGDAAASASAGAEGDRVVERLSDVELCAPQGVVYDRRSNILFVSDTGCDRIVAVDRTQGTAVSILVDFSAVKQQ